MGVLETDYLVVGAGADRIVVHRCAHRRSRRTPVVVMVDRRSLPGGTGTTPTRSCGFTKPPPATGSAAKLGDDRIDESGFNAGLYEQADASRSATTSGG